MCNQNEIAFAQVKLNNCCNEEYDNVLKIKNSVFITATQTSFWPDGILPLSTISCWFYTETEDIHWSCWQKREQMIWKLWFIVLVRQNKCSGRAISIRKLGSVHYPWSEIGPVIILCWCVFLKDKVLWL